MAKMYYEKDCNLKNLNGKTVVVIGFGSQGHAHALNLHDSGVNVIVGLYEGSESAEKARAAGLTVMNTPDAVKLADVTMILVNDENQAKLYKNDIAPYLKKGSALAFAHGFNIHFKQIIPSPDVDVIMIAPKGPGHTVRSQFLEGRGVPCLIAVYQDATGQAKDIALAYALGMAATRGHTETSFKEETETDLFRRTGVLAARHSADERGSIRLSRPATSESPILSAFTKWAIIDLSRPAARRSCAIQSATRGIRRLCFRQTDYNR